MRWHGQPIVGQLPAHSGEWRLGWAWDAAGPPAALQSSFRFFCDDGTSGVRLEGGAPPCALSIHATVRGDGALVTSLTVAIRRPAAHVAAVRDADARWTAEAVEKAKNRKPAL